MRPPKTLIRIGLALLIVVATVLVVRVVFNYTEGRMLARTLAGLKERGVPMTAQDLAPPCTDEDNAARLWKAAESLLTSEDQESRKAIAGAFGRYAGGLPVEPGVLDVVRRLAAANETALGLVAEMGAKPCFRLRAPDRPLYESLLPSAPKMINATRLLGFSALFRAEDGDVAGAVDRAVAGLRSAQLVAGEGNLMAWLIALADTRMMAHFLGEICRGRDLPEGTLTRLVAELDPPAWRERLAAAVRGERVLFIEVGGLASRGGTKDLAWLFGEPSRIKNLGIWLARPLVRRDVRKTLPRYDELEALALRPFFESRPILREQAKAMKALPRHAFLSKAMWTNQEAAFMKGAVLEATLLVSRTGLACRLYKSRNGTYPEALEALVPGILTEVPVDPFTGRPLVYRRDGDGFVVYSLGSNEKDDGGRSTYMYMQLVADKDDDWAWKEDR